MPTSDALAALNPLAPELAIDPYPTYATLRKHEPVHQSAFGAYVLTRHADVTHMLSDTVTFQHQYVRQQQARLGPQVEAEPYLDSFRRMIFVLDDPDHRRIRKLVSHAFTPRRIRELRDRAVGIATELIDQREPAREMDLIADFAYPLPLRIIGSILGIPNEDHETIGSLATALNPVLEFLPMNAEVLAAANSAVGELTAYFSALAAKRRSEPTDDLFSVMVHATEDGDTLTDDELVANAILLYVAGNETTAGGLGLMLLALHRNPDQLALLKAQPELRLNAVEELLRYDTPGQATARVLTTDVTLADTTLAAGTIVLGYIGAANRDPDVYREPDTLDLTRNFSQLPRPLTWGGGAHLCLGRMLALQEFDVALEILFSRCPDMTLDTLEPEFRPTPLMRGLASLNVHW